MRRVFDRIAGRLRGFLDQRDNVALVVRTQGAANVAMLKILESIDEESASEFFWTYAGDFSSPRSYVSDIVRDFATKHDGARLAMEFQGMKPWPAIPAPVMDESAAIADRLRELMIFTRSLLPAPSGTLVVWLLFPLNNVDPAGYGALIRELLQHQFPFPWFHQIRIVLNEDTAMPAVSAALAGTPRIDYFTPDLSDEAFDQALEEEADDEELPLADRIQAVFLSAHRDSAFGRFDQALEKHELVLRYHTAIDNPAMVALALNSVGEIHQRAGRAGQAGRCFETALQPACEGENPPLPVLFNIVLNLANLRLGERRFSEAETYFQAAEQLATVQRNPSAKLQAIENAGYCQYMQGRTGEAVENWRRGASLAGQLEQRELQRRLLTRLRQYFSGANQPAEQREVEAQLAALSDGSS
jgi:hypothetical protein